MENIVLALQVPVMPEPGENVLCTACARFAPQQEMEFREHFGGFWMCADKIACTLRSHLAICSSLLIVPNRFCVYCTAGTMRRPDEFRSLIRRHGGF